MSRTFPVTFCLQDGCHHPGGQHLGGKCRLCDCPGWDEAKTRDGRWSFEQLHEAERKAGLRDDDGGAS